MQEYEWGNAVSGSESGGVRRNVSGRASVSDWASVSEVGREWGVSVRTYSE